MECLRGHTTVATETYQELMAMLATPPSQLETDKVNELVQTYKSDVKDIDADIKDAKKRINLVKGPTKKPPKQDTGDVSGAEDSEGS